jgi:antitoxin HicB
MKAETRRLPERRYSYSIRQDEDGDFVGRVEELPGCVAHGRSRAAALRRLMAVEKLWVADALARGEDLPEPRPGEQERSGRWVQRVPRSLHTLLVQLAKDEGVSLNQMVLTALAAYTGARRTAPDVGPRVEVRSIQELVRP